MDRCPIPFKTWKRSVGPAQGRRSSGGNRASPNLGARARESRDSGCGSSFRRWPGLGRNPRGRLVFTGIFSAPSDEAAAAYLGPFRWLGPRLGSLTRNVL